jgi:hypothetical protein
MTRKSLAWLWPRLLLELELEEDGVVDGDGVVGVVEGAEEVEPGCWLGWLACESDDGGGGAGCCARETPTTPATLANESAQTPRPRIIEIARGTHMNRSSPCPIRTCGIV